MKLPPYTEEEWRAYVQDYRCPRCQDPRRGWKMCNPPICIGCGWKATVEEQEAADEKYETGYWPPDGCATGPIL